MLYKGFNFIITTSNLESFNLLSHETVPNIDKEYVTEPAMVIHACDPIIWEVEVEN